MPVDRILAALSQIRAAATALKYSPIALAVPGDLAAVFRFNEIMIR